MAALINCAALVRRTHIPLKSTKSYNVATSLFKYQGLKTMMYGRLLLNVKLSD